MDHIIVVKYCDVVLQSDDSSVLGLAYLNSYFQTGLKNLMDRAVIQFSEDKTLQDARKYTKVDEIPFDFSRKIMSVVVKAKKRRTRLLGSFAKGASEEVFKTLILHALTSWMRQIYPMERVILDDLREEHDNLSRDGFRVLAIAHKDFPDKPSCCKDDECDLILKGYIAFLDPPKDSSRAALKALQEHGVSVKVLTGDNDLVSRKICAEVGVGIDKVLVGPQIEKMTDAELETHAEETTLFARLSPAHKQRIIKALQSTGHVVGFLGDGINDAPALRAADVGISTSIRSGRHRQGIRRRHPTRKEPAGP